VVLVRVVAVVMALPDAGVSRRDGEAMKVRAVPRAGSGFDTCRRPSHVRTA